jgi:hypothetical protein
MKIMIVRSEKISISFRSGIREEKFLLLTLKI